MWLHPRIAGALGLCLLITACAGRGTLVIDAEAPVAGTVIPILVATSRAATDGPELFAGSRSDGVSFLRFNVSVPPERSLGQVTFPTELPPSPQTDFYTVSAQRLAGPQGFLAAVNAAVAEDRRGSRDASLFVHGYNTTFVEGLYRNAQLKHDYESAALPVHYSWPSAATAQGYVYDLESALFARDGLEKTIELLTRSRIDDLLLVAHSMGGQVLMETLRQMALRGDAAAFRKISAVVLFSPDLNLDLFRGQLAAIAPYDIPVYLFVSQEDRALRVSSLLRGEQSRVGSIADEDWAALDYDVTLVDLTDLEGGDPLRHFSAGTAPALIGLIRGMNVKGAPVFDEGTGQSGVFSGGISLIQEGTGLIFEPLVQR